MEVVHRGEVLADLGSTGCWTAQRSSALRPHRAVEVDAGSLRDRS
jgi:hypothetical protein